MGDDIMCYTGTLKILICFSIGNRYYKSWRSIQKNAMLDDVVGSARISPILKRYYQEKEN